MFANLRLAVELDPTLIPARIKYGTLLVARSNMTMPSRRPRRC